MIFVLLIAAIVVGALQGWIELGLILAVVVLNVVIGLLQEGKAEKAAEAIKAMLSVCRLFQIWRFSKQLKPVFTSIFSGHCCCHSGWSEVHH